MGIHVLVNWNTQQWPSSYSYLTSGHVIDKMIKKNTVKTKTTVQHVMHIIQLCSNGIMAPYCVVQIHNEMRKTSQSMPITLNGPHSNQKCRLTENPNKVALPFQTPQTLHRAVNTVIPSLSQEHNQPAPTHPTMHPTKHPLMDPNTQFLRHPSDTPPVNTLSFHHSAKNTTSQPPLTPPCTQPNTHSCTQPHNSSATPQTLHQSTHCHSITQPRTQPARPHSPHHAPNQTPTHGPKHTIPQTPLRHSTSQHTVIPSLSQEHNQPAPTHPTMHPTIHLLTDPTIQCLRHPSDTPPHIQPNTYSRTQPRNASATPPHIQPNTYSWMCWQLPNIAYCQLHQMGQGQHPISMG